MHRYNAYKLSENVSCVLQWFVPIDQNSRENRDRDVIKGRDHVNLIYRQTQLEDPRSLTLEINNSQQWESIFISS